MKHKFFRRIHIGFLSPVGQHRDTQGVRCWTGVAAFFLRTLLLQQHV